MDEGAYTGSDHQCITFGVRDNGPERPPIVAEEQRGWALRKLDVDKLTAYIRDKKADRGNEWPGTDADAAVEAFHQYVRTGCDLSMPKRGGTVRRRPVYWWNEDIAARRAECIALRRVFQRAGRRSGDRETERMAYLSAKKDLRKAIRSSQERAWKELQEKVDRDVWGLPYKVVMKRLSRNPPGVHLAGRELELASQLFPRRSEFRWRDVPMMGPGGSSVKPVRGSDIRPLTAEELAEARKRLPKGNAPGPDAVPNEILEIFLRRPGGSTEAVQRLLV